MPRSLRERQPKAEAKKLFFQHISLPEIAKRTGIPHKTLSQWAYGRPDTDKEKTWKWQREEAERVIMEGISQENEYWLRQIYEISLPTIAKSLKKYDGSSLSLEECQQMVDIVSKTEKLFKLAQNDKLPAGSGAAAPMTLIEIKNIIDGDYFRKIKDVSNGAPVSEPADVRQLPSGEGFDFDEPIPQPKPKPAPVPRPSEAIDHNRVNIMEQEDDGGGEPADMPGEWAD